VTTTAPVPPENTERLRRFEDRMTYPLLVSAVVPLLLGDSSGWVADSVLVATWLVFVYDLIMHMRLRPHYLRTHYGKFDLVVVIITAPWFLIPGMGYSRLLVLARLGRLARLIVGTKAGRRAFQRVGKVGIFATAMVGVTALAVFQAERSTNPEFSTFGDALWWAFVTVTTVGYGDKVPSTTSGRFVAAVLMVTGIAVLGVLAGILAELFRIAPPPPPSSPPTAEAPPDVADELAALREQLVSLERLLGDQRGGSGAEPPPDH
jgi:voltage-gated potassium channel